MFPVWVYIWRREKKHGATARFDSNLKRTVKEQCSTWPILFYFFANNFNVLKRVGWKFSLFRNCVICVRQFIYLFCYLALLIVLAECNSIFARWWLFIGGSLHGLKKKKVGREQRCLPVCRYFSSTQPCIGSLIAAGWEWRPDFWLLFLFHILSWISFLPAHKQTKRV